MILDNFYLQFKHAKLSVNSGFFSRMILDNFYLQFKQSFYMDQEQLTKIRAALYEVIKLWFQRLTNLIHVWKCHSCENVNSFSKKWSKKAVHAMLNILSDIIESFSLTNVLNSAVSYNFTRFELLSANGENWRFQTWKKLVSLWNQFLIH